MDLRIATHAYQSESKLIVLEISLVAWSAMCHVSLPGSLICLLLLEVICCSLSEDEDYDDMGAAPPAAEPDTADALQAAGIPPPASFLYLGVKDAYTFPKCPPPPPKKSMPAPKKFTPSKKAPIHNKVPPKERHASEAQLFPKYNKAEGGDAS